MNNNKWLILIPLALVISLLVISIFFFVKYKDTQMNILVSNYENAIKTNLNNWKQDILTKIENRNFITNSSLSKFWEQTYDDNTTDTYNIINDIIWATDEWTLWLEEVNIIDKTITNRTWNFERLWEQEPDKQNNIFEIDLVNFLDTDWSEKDTISYWDLELRWWTSPSNTSDVFLVMWRLKKNSTISLDSLYNQEISKLSGWTVSEFWTSWNDTDLFSVNYQRLEGGNSGCSFTIDDSIWDPNFRWCKTVPIEDILSWWNLNLRDYNYKLYLVFALNDTDKELTPFKLENTDSWRFWVWNFVQADLTLLTWDNTKRRVYLNASTKNNVLSYLLYSLQAKGKIILENEDS